LPAITRRITHPSRQAYYFRKISVIINRYKYSSYRRSYSKLMNIKVRHVNPVMNKPPFKINKTPIILSLFGLLYQFTGCVKGFVLAIR